MNLQQLFPEVAAWNITKLVDDINVIRKTLHNKGNISQMQQNYLCGILAGHNPKNICQILNLNGKGKSIRTAFSTQINPYIKELLNLPENQYMDWQRVRVLLENAGYKKTLAPPDSQSISAINIKLDLDNPTMMQLQSLLTKLRSETQDSSLILLDIRRGCIILCLSGSEEGLKRLEYLVKSGVLTELNGIRIINAQKAVEASRIVRLSNWLDNLVESGWEALDRLLSPQQLQFEDIRSDDIRRAKLIDRTMVAEGFAVVLTLKQERLNRNYFNIGLRMYPTGENKHLPSGIKMRMFGMDKDGNQVDTDIQASNWDEWIQLNFKGETGEEFAVEIVKEDISVIENFVI